MSKVRIYSLAKDLGIESARMLEILSDLGVSAKSASSTLDEDTVEAVKAIVAEVGAKGQAAVARDDRLADAIQQFTMPGFH